MCLWYITCTSHAYQQTLVGVSAAQDQPYKMSTEGNMIRSDGQCTQVAGDPRSKNGRQETDD